MAIGGVKTLTSSIFFIIAAVLSPSCSTQKKAVNFSASDLASWKTSSASISLIFWAATESFGSRR